MRVIWAIDAIGESALLVERAAEFLRHLAKRVAIEIEPVSVLEKIRQESGFEDSLLTDDQALAGLKRSLMAITSEFEDLAPHFLSAFVISGSTHSPAKRLARHAREREADLILCSTHSRHGIPRLILGSFTEELLKTSEVPVAVVRVRPVPEPGRAVLWTDFSSGSATDFRNVVQQCLRFGSRLALFHCPERPVEPIFQGGAYLFSGAQPQLHRWTSPELVRLERRGLAWARWAEHQGVDCQFVMDERPGRFAEHLIEWLEANGAGLAFVRWSPRARELLRRSPCPVWVLR